MDVVKNKTIPEMEDDTTRFWKENSIFEKSVNKNPAENAYIFYDGPPFISGLPHYGHLLGSIAKDVIPRYWTMKGKRVERVWGWDAHGLTVENKVQQRLGIKNRKDIEKFGLEKFTEECYKYTSETSAEWEWYIDKIGRWVDFKHAYKTIDQNYMESVIWAFKQLYDKGLVYEGIRTSLFCTTCGTPVSNFEIAMDNSYKEVEDPAITVKFPVITEGKFKGFNILAWTTTPWTMPSNRALVVDPDATYALVESAGEMYIVAKPRVEATFSGMSYKLAGEVLGKDLISLEYEPPYRFFAQKEGEFKVYSFEGMVSMDEGTGIVHSAPGFGEIDTEMGRKYGLTIMMTIDDEGKFLPGNNGNNPYAGMFYEKANGPIREDLKQRNILFRDERIVHRFPYHDRCNTLLIQKAQNSWFVNVQKLKPEMIKNNENINWVPPNIKEGRFKINIEQAPDWCISRTRFWATPMPVWESADGDRIVVSSVKEIEELSGQKVRDLHRPYIDDIILKKDGKEYKRRTEVLDSWMEAGGMPYAQVHYPFENNEKFEKTFPGDYIVEYVAQVRAWFYVMHVLSTALFGSNSFKNVVVTGVMAGSDGRKMSKTFNNYTDPKQLLETIGGDALRLYLMGSPLMVAENANFDEVELRNKSRNVLNPLWNSAKFFMMYADLHKWSNSKIVASTNLLDKWILARLNQTVEALISNLEAYTIPPTVQLVESFVDDLSRWYVRRSRERISGGDNEALSTLYTVLSDFAKASAPLMPFMSENIYRSLIKYGTGEIPESIHLCDYPIFDKSLVDETLLADMKIAREIVSLGHSQRIESKISVRQPLSKALVTGVVKLGKAYIEIIKEELNVKEVLLVKSEKADLGVTLDTVLTEELQLEGFAREMVRQLQDLRKSQNLSISDKVDAVFQESTENLKVVEKFGEEIKKKVLAESLIPGPNYEINKKP